MLISSNTIFKLTPYPTVLYFKYHSIIYDKDLCSKNSFRIDVPGVTFCIHLDLPAISLRAPALFSIIIASKLPAIYRTAPTNSTFTV